MSVTEKPPIYLNGKQLAELLNVCEHYITAMKRAGFEFELPTKTSLASAVKWLKSVRRQFVARRYLMRGWEKLPKLPLADSHPPAAAAGK